LSALWRYRGHPSQGSRSRWASRRQYLFITVDASHAPSMGRPFDQRQRIATALMGLSMGLPRSSSLSATCSRAFSETTVSTDADGVLNIASKDLVAGAVNGHRSADGMADGTPLALSSRCSSRVGV
jgi:hypothetical protein